MPRCFKLLLVCIIATLFVADSVQLISGQGNSGSACAVAEAGLIPLKAKWGKKVVDTLGNVSCLVGKGKSCWVVYWGSSNLTVSTSGIDFDAAEE